jgi:DNA polymerase I-like protein with 3'-5' exonuclease and polymerase domains
MRMLIKVKRMRMAIKLSIQMERLEIIKMAMLRIQRNLDNNV